MTRVTRLAVPLLVVALLAWPAGLSAAKAAKTHLLPNGTVKSVTASALTVTAKGKDTTFAVDAKTRVIGKGIGTKADAKGGKAAITDLLAAGDRVSVVYVGPAATPRATRVELVAKAGSR